MENKETIEEPKQVLCGEANKFYRCVNCDAPCGSEGHYIEHKQESNFFEELKNYFKTTPKEKVLEDWAKSDEFDNVSIGETIEEAAEIYYEENIDQSNIPRGKYEWQQQQDKKLYTEEELLKILQDYRNNFEVYRNIQVLPNMFLKWFENVKKK